MSARAGSVRRAAPVRENATRRRILDAALRLFNERGTAHVTTNLVALAAGLSPGNVYYWFRDKQDIVRVLVADWLQAYDRHWDEVHDLPANVHALWDDLGRTSKLARRYAFVRRELSGLMFDDQDLAETVRGVYRRRLAAQVAYARRLVTAGILEPPEPPRTLEDLVTAVWLISESWATHLERTYEPKDTAGAPSGIRPLLAVLTPYLTPSGLRALEAL